MKKEDMRIMKITKRFFSDSAYGKVHAYTLDSGESEATVLDLGGILQKWVYDGKDIVCGFDHADDYLRSSCYYGAIVGRVCNRGYDVNIDGKTFPISKNENGVNTLHGGFSGFDKKIWNVSELPEENALRLSLLSPDGEEGYPGNLNVSVTYRLEGTTLKIEYEAVSDRDTVVNLTNHSYFNLDGIGGTVLEHNLYIPAYFISECDTNHIPTGKHLPCWDGPLDFNAKKPIGKDIAKPHPQLTPWGGYDNNYILRKAGGALQMVALAEGNDLQMEVLSDAPCLQLYTANDSHEEPMKYGKPQIRNRAFCIETQKEPNAYSFAEDILRAGQVFRTTTWFRLDRVR